MVRRGFSLVEAVAVLALLAILAGIATAGFAVAQRNTNAESAQRTLETVWLAELSYAQRTGVFTVDAADLVVPGGVTIADVISDGPRTVSVVAGSDGSLGLAVLDSDDICHAAYAEAPSSGAALTPVEVPTSAPCHASVALPAGVAVND